MKAINNKLIAEFMELPKVPCNIGTEDGHFTEGYKHPKIDVPIIPSGMKYKYSWDWLMPVVERIENLGYEFVIVENRVKVAHNTDNSIKTIIVFTIGGSKRDATYQAVVGFINKYNKQTL